MARGDGRPSDDPSSVAEISDVSCTAVLALPLCRVAGPNNIL